MIRLGWLLIACAAYFLLWQECGENPLVFCYRIAWSVFDSLRSRALVPVRVSSRKNTAWSNSSNGFSTRSTMLKD